MFSKNSFFDGLAGIFDDVNQLAKTPDAAFLAEIAPYCDKLGILVPELPDIPYFVEKIVGSLGKELLSLNSAKSAGPLAKSLIEDTKTKAFALHQIAGIMEKHGKIKPETCAKARRETFLNAVSTIDAIQTFEAEVNYVGSAWDTVKEVFRETVKEPLKDEARKLVKDEVKQRNKATEEQKQEDKAEKTEEKDSIQEALATAKSYVKAAVAAKDLKTTLTRSGGYDYDQHEAYVESMNDYIDTKDKNQRLKIASRSLYVEGAQKNLNDRVEKVAKNELGVGFMDKASSIFNNFMTEVHTMLDFTPDLKAIQNKLEAREAVVNKQFDLLSKNDASFNINNLEGHKKIINNQRPVDITDEIENLRLRAKMEGNSHENFYNALNEEANKARLLETKCNLLEEKIDEATQNLKSLKSNVVEYVVSREDAWFNDFCNKIVENFFPEDMPVEKKKSVKIPAAQKLQKEIQSGPQEYSELQQKALAEGTLGNKAKDFKNYKDRFFKDVEKIKSETDLDESSHVKIK